MGGCANSKYAVGEDKVESKNKPTKAPKDKKGKKDKTPTKNDINQTVNNSNNNNKDTQPQQVPATPTPPIQNGTAATEPTPKPDDNKTTKNLEDGLEFIDKEEIEKQNLKQQQQQQQQQDGNENENSKKEVTTYQTTVVKHIEKEGDELLVHLKDEAFQTLKNFLKQTKINETNIKSTIDGEKVSTSSYTNNNNANEDELLNEIKLQVFNAIKNTTKNEENIDVDEKKINSIIDTSAALIKQNTVQNMNDLEASLNRQYENNEILIKKIINSTTGFLTAKGTEAGTMLSNILANLTNTSIQGELKETEKTTVKVTRTITEKIVNSKGETKIIVKKITDTINNANQATTEELVKKLSSNETAAVETTTTTTTQQQVTTELPPQPPVETVNGNNNELTGLLVASKLKIVLDTQEQENKNEQKKNDDHETIEQARQVVNNVLTAAILKLNQELVNVNEINNNNNNSHENINKSSSRDDIASEFYKHGKDAAEKLIKTVDSNNHINNNSNSNNNKPNLNN